MAAAGLPTPWRLHTDLDVLATTELAAVDYPQLGGLTWIQLTDITSAALAADGCAGWSVCIYNPDLEPAREGADNIVSYLTQAITAADRRLPCGAPGPAGSCGARRQRHGDDRLQRSAPRCAVDVADAPGAGPVKPGCAARSLHRRRADAAVETVVGLLWLSLAASLITVPGARRGAS
jgi:hypothetical protein